MARVSDNPVTQEHYTAQLALSTGIAKAVARLGSPRPVNQAAALAQEFSRAAISLASDYYGDARLFAGVKGSYKAPVVAPWEIDNLVAYFDTALDSFHKQLDVATIDFDAEIDRIAAQLALDAGTRELFTAIDNDPKPTRYARVTREGACSFCLLQAIRGAVYRSEESASFRPHLSCHCDVEPVWGAYKPPEHIRAAQELYSEATADLPRGADRMNAFRRAVYADRKPPARRGEPKPPQEGMS